MAHGDVLCLGCSRGSVISEVQYTFEREPPQQPQPQPQPQPLLPPPLPPPSGQKRRAETDAAGGAGQAGQGAAAAAKRVACELLRGAAEAAEEGAAREAMAISTAAQVTQEGAAEEVEEEVVVEAVEEEAADEETAMEMGVEETATEMGLGVRAEVEAAMGASGSPGGGPPRRLCLLHSATRGEGGEEGSGSETEGEEEEEVKEVEGEEEEEVKEVVVEEAGYKVVEDHLVLLGLDASLRTQLVYLGVELFVVRARL